MPFASLVCPVWPLTSACRCSGPGGYKKLVRAMWICHVRVHTAPCSMHVVWWSWGYMCGCAGPAGRRNHACMRVAAAMQCMQAPYSCSALEGNMLAWGRVRRSGVVRGLVRSPRRPGRLSAAQHSTAHGRRRPAGSLPSIHPSPNLRCACAIGRPSCGWHCTPSCALWCLCWWLLATVPKRTSPNRVTTRAAPRTSAGRTWTWTKPGS